ncbi:MD-2-related lipid-recognition domain containing protein [Trema orientale]|uniref:MD-2-related lipid-recognition domain containing protein n=1 Tax=Trema orientale TaxID=63057 RepID=A0A2P5FKP9_TREOI|nr:MD-2-related lipid-recognition domain containing protein [Trema orientale]
MAQMKLLVALLVSFYLIAPLAQATDVKYCDTQKNYLVKVNGLDIDPNPVVRGKPATFKISATTDTPLSGGKLVVDVSYFGLHIHSEDHDLCTETSCPVSIGDFVVSHSQVLPGFTPPGTYKLTMKMNDENGHQLTCINFSFSIGLGSSVADS